MRRTKGKTDFYRSWEAYKQGFGCDSDDFWLGNDAIYNLTNTYDHELRIDAQNEDGEHLFAHYTSFSIMDEKHGYRLRVGPLSARTTDGNSTDLGFTEYNGERFSTHDHRPPRRLHPYDYDRCKHYKDLKKLQGGWWFERITLIKDCHFALLFSISNLNAGWDRGVKLETRRQEYFLTSTEMKIRRI
ncbi:ficolin-1 [Elysia marginata]|uniref:Ficolin-1 n=1 Tax=Elysia marginata TaxID=1093978 RepID=A0AAV4I1R1_9GAST|nr:ficolin-1 [Elysia marginata]